MMRKNSHALLLLPDAHPNNAREDDYREALKKGSSGPLARTLCPTAPAPNEMAPNVVAPKEGEPKHFHPATLLANSCLIVSAASVKNERGRIFNSLMPTNATMIAASTEKATVADGAPIIVLVPR